jgi:hypothetical protein
MPKGILKIPLKNDPKRRFYVTCPCDFTSSYEFHGDEMEIINYIEQLFQAKGYLIDYYTILFIFLKNYKNVQNTIGYINNIIANKY